MCFKKKPRCVRAQAGLKKPQNWSLNLIKSALFRNFLTFLCNKNHAKICQNSRKESKIKVKTRKVSIHYLCMLGWHKESEGPCRLWTNFRNKSFVLNEMLSTASKQESLSRPKFHHNTYVCINLMYKVSCKLRGKEPYRWSIFLVNLPSLRPRPNFPSRGPLCLSPAVISDF